MTLYDRNYCLKPNDNELAEYSQIYESEKIPCSSIGQICKYSQYPRAMRHYLSLFPNNLMELNDYRENAESDADSFEKFLSDKSISERDILNFINKENHFHIIASLLSGGGYNFGHHATFVFPEFEILNNYKVDYLIVGNASGGHQFLFVEFENPYGSITTNDGELGSTFRKGIKQVKDWDRLLQGNFSSLIESFKKYTKPGTTFSNEFHKFDSSRIHFAVVAGRRSNFNDVTYAIKREKDKKENIKIFHYDNLCDYAKSNLNSNTY